MSSAPPRWSPQPKRASEVTPPERRAPGKNVKLTMAVVEGDHTKKLARPPNGKKESSTKPKVGSHYVHGDHGGARGASFTVPKRRLSLPFAGAEAAAATAASLIEVVKDVPLTLAEEETLRVKFNEFDLNGDGSLDKQEIANLLRVCDRYTNDDAVEALVDAVDDNGTHIGTHTQLPASPTTSSLPQATAASSCASCSTTCAPRRRRSTRPRSLRAPRSSPPSPSARRRPRCSSRRPTRK